MKVFFKAFDSKMASREKIFKIAIEYATQVGPERLINITHSEDHDNIVVCIWYWAEEEIKLLTAAKTKSSPGFVLEPPEQPATAIMPRPPELLSEEPPPKP